MANYSVCGIDCDTCKYKQENGCKGCRVCAPKGECVWGGRCELYDCAVEKKLEHCGLCGDFPCAKLKEWAEAENDERIDNLRKLIEA